jgi:glycosyltransferase involved in cell wall biosynthesis/SAM-dependent methyltransferase
MSDIWSESARSSAYSQSDTSSAPSCSAAEAAKESKPSLTPTCEAGSEHRPRLDLVVVIPAFCPGNHLPDLVRALAPAENERIVIVDDGSGPEFAAIFDQLDRVPNVHVLRHAVNLGKGSALKTGVNFVLCTFPGAQGVLTMDVDGQHSPADARQVWERFRQSPDSLILGVRHFGKDVPLRSRLGNTITRGAVGLLIGHRLADTQTGLRAIPRALLADLLRVPANGYEFELEMLIAVKHLGLKVVEQPISTIYEDGNRSSHFRPLRDSMRIYFVLLRFALIGVVTAIIDNIAFFLSFNATQNIAQAQTIARLVALAFNYTFVRRAVFLSAEKHRVLLPRYLVVAFLNGAFAFLGIKWLTGMFGAPVLSAKLGVEALLFAANFVVQRDCVFTKRNANASTDWDHYYKSVPLTARLTRRYTSSVLISALRKFAKPDAVIVEIGGANSCFIQAFLKHLRPLAYHVVDNNAYGLSLLRKRTETAPVFLHHGDVLRLAGVTLTADVVLSVGLIEHFGAEDTKRAITAHFDLLRPGGIAILSFPTPTVLYRLARHAAETFRMWQFPDERPLVREEVLEAIHGLGHVLFEKTLWPLVFTQHLIVVRKSR